ncbi:unannotated protein [freshwater metagenome]|uniref:Unannotated protein n=1 Tax=freshwater metagenome TaxID=449393 RepID=A0A6J7FZP0_9ZZZZ|nr:hypothetical protein [Actinomycetota bacterium]
MRRAVIVGSGSAGRRHVAALRSIEPEILITVVQRTESVQPREELLDLKASFASTLDEALALPPDVCVVANPSPLHADAAVRLLGLNSPVLIEKPLAADVRSAQAIQTAERNTKNHALLGYHLRFGDLLPELRRLVRSGVIGAPTGFSFRVGQHLGSWRTGTEAAASVSARAELGGGVLLELSHEFDALCFALDCTATSVTHCDLRFDGAPTDGKVETVAEVDLVTSTGIAGSVHLDMVAPEPVRDWVILGTEGTLRVDALRSTIRHENPEGTAQTIAEFAGGERDRAERRLIEHLLELSNPAIHPGCTTEDGIVALAIIEAARKSYMSGQVAPVELHVRLAP